MDKLSYLSAVQGLLLALPESEIRAALDYYMEQIDALMREGLSEEEAVARMPDPQTAAEQIMQGLAVEKARPPEAPPRKKRAPVLPLLLLGLLFLGAAAVGLFFTRTARSVQPYEEKQAEISEPFSALRLEVGDAEVTVNPSGDGRCLVRWEENEQVGFTFTVEDGCLRVSQKEQVPSLNLRGPKLELQLPAATYQTLELRSGSGSVSLSGQNAQTLSMKTQSGSVACSDCAAQKISLESSSGSVRALDLEAEQLRSLSSSGSQKLTDLRADQLSVEASSGSVHLKGAQCRILSAVCSSGSLNVDDCRASKQARLRCSSGSIRFEKLDAGTVSVESTSGSIKGSVAQRMKFEASSGSGSLDLPESDAHGGLFQAKTGSGSIHVTVSG